MKCFGHADCGVYGEVVDAGTIAVGDGIVAAPAGRFARQ
jgi:MOSC domain-containing protein YiiM